MILSCSPESRKPKRSNVGLLTKSFRQSAKQIKKWSEMSKKTLWRWLEKLEKARRISTFSDMKKWSIPILDSAGAPEIEYVPGIEIENAPENVPVEESDPFLLQLACVRNRLRFV